MHSSNINFFNYLQNLNRISFITKVKVLQKKNKSSKIKNCAKLAQKCELDVWAQSGPKKVVMRDNSPGNDKSIQMWEK